MMGECSFFLSKITIYNLFFVDIIYRFFLYVLLYLKRCANGNTFCRRRDYESESAVLF